MKAHTEIIEYKEANLSAYVPDPPGCLAAGDTREEDLANILQSKVADWHLRENHRSADALVWLGCQAPPRGSSTESSSPGRAFAMRPARLKEHAAY